MSVIIGVGLIASLISLIFLTTPVIKRSPRFPFRTEAISNLKQVHLVLIEFNDEFGGFPDASTIADVQAATKTRLHLGTVTSNDLFRQLIAHGANSEKIFSAKTQATRRMPDDVVVGAEALKKGECAFAYVAGLSSSSPLDTPLAMAPLIPGTLKFDPKPFEGKAVVLRVDGSVRAESIDPSGHVMTGGRNLFDPSQPYWKGKVPDIKYPE